MYVAVLIDKSIHLGSWIDVVIDVQREQTFWLVLLLLLRASTGDNNPTPSAITSSSPCQSARRRNQTWVKIGFLLVLRVPGHASADRGCWNG